jgi:cysteine synthase A
MYLKRRRHKVKNKVYQNYESLIGNTPLLYLEKLSKLIGGGMKIYVKMESSNPGGTGKDRAALFMLQNAEEKGYLPPPQSKGNIEYSALHSKISEKQQEALDDNSMLVSSIFSAIQRSSTGGIVVEGTSGSTGISLSTLAAQRGHSIIIVMPDDQSKEKQTILKCLGAVLHVVPTASISNPNHYVNIAQKIARIINDDFGSYGIKASFMNQFENEANFLAHYKTTGPEIWQQTYGSIQAFCMSSGTGGTISGVGTYLKEQSKLKESDCKVCLVDPPGSSLYNKVKYNVAFAKEQSERGLLRHRYDTIAEGIGLDRLTNNFSLGVEHGVLDDAVRVTDQEAVDFAHWLLKEEGLFVGSSSAMNVIGAVRVAMEMDANSIVVTVICDGGQRHLTRFWNRDFVLEWGLQWPEDDLDAWKSRLPLPLQ